MCGRKWGRSDRYMSREQALYGLPKEGPAIFLLRMRCLRKRVKMQCSILLREKRYHHPHVPSGTRTNDLRVDTLGSYRLWKDIDQRRDLAIISPIDVWGRQYSHDNLGYGECERHP